MAVTIELAGRSFEVAPFKFDALRLAAPHVDRLNELVQEAEAKIKDGKSPSLAGAADMMAEAIEIIAIGLVKIDEQMTVEGISALVDFSHVASLQQAAFALLAASGLAPKGEAKAPSRKKAAKGAISPAR